MPFYFYFFFFLRLKQVHKEAEQAMEEMTEQWRKEELASQKKYRKMEYELSSANSIIEELEMTVCNLIFTTNVLLGMIG